MRALLVCLGGFAIPVALIAAGFAFYAPIVWIGRTFGEYPAVWFSLAWLFVWIVAGQRLYAWAERRGLIG